MRIAVWHNTPSGGARRALYYHVRGLVARGHEVESWCPSTADPSYLPLRLLAPEHVIELDSSLEARNGAMWRYVRALVRMREMDSIAEAMARVLGDSALAKSMGERACEYVRREWNVDRSVDRLEANLLRVIGSARRKAACSAH